MKVLIADDHPLYSEGMASHLRQLLSGAHMVKVTSVAELRQTVQASERPDLVLVGFGIPGMSPSVLKALVQELSGVPLAIISGTMTNADVNKAIRMGVRGYIPSTTSPEYFSRAVQILLAGGVSVPADVFVDTLRPRTGGWQGELSERETDVIKGIVRGLSNKEIANELGIAEVTVKLHLRNIYQKMNVRRRVEAAVMASRAYVA